MSINKLSAIYHSLTITPIVKLFKKNIKKINFEFMDLHFIPSSLRATLRDILEVGNGAPFRKYYDWTTVSIYEYAKLNNIKEIIELGAGNAPITKRLTVKYPNWDVKFKVSDLNPDKISFNFLENLDARVKPIYEPFDFSKKIQGLEGSLLILSATFHHIEEEKKKLILLNLKKLSPHVLIFEPLRPTFISLLFVLAALISGIVTPIFKINTKNFYRCLIWCWLIPIAPILFIWDGWISSIRCWTKNTWLDKEPNAQVCETLFCSKILLTKQSI